MVPIPYVRPEEEAFWLSCYRRFKRALARESEVTDEQAEGLAALLAYEAGLAALLAYEAVYANREQEDK